MTGMEQCNSLMEKVKGLPSSPGCYIFKNKRDEIIYIGKSKSLKHRVIQYFQRPDAKEGKYLLLLREIVDVEILQTESEMHALILECMLVKAYRPKYNAQLVRTKVYPYIKIDISAEYPTISITKEYKKDGSEYFGIFRNDDEAFENIQLINQIWQTPLCGRSQFVKSHRSCLNYHLNKCCAPCEGRIEKSEYRARIMEIMRCLKGEPDSVIRRLKKAMQEAAKDMDFEKAVLYRDEIKQLEVLRKKSKRLRSMMDKRDIYLFFRAYNGDDMGIFFIRNGRVVSYIEFKEESNTYMDDLIGFVRGIKNQTLNNDYHMLVFDIFQKQLERKTTYYPVSELPIFLTVCLRDIFADKLYLPIAKQQSAEKTVECLIKEIEEFMGL